MCQFLCPGMSLYVSAYIRIHACIALAARCFFVATYSTLSCVRNQQDADLSRVISDLASAVPMKCGRSQNPASHFLPKEACSFYKRDLFRRCSAHQASRFLTYTGRNWPNPVCSFYLPVSMCRDATVSRRVRPIHINNKLCQLKLSMVRKVTAVVIGQTLNPKP